MTSDSSLLDQAWSAQRDEARNDDVGRLTLLASAISNRPIRVAAAAPGEPAWTDGKVIFVDAHGSTREQVESLAVQASLLAAGSLDRDIVQGLARRPALARRYLAMEGHRALATVEELLPPRLSSLIHRDVASSIDSPAASLAAAHSRKPILDPPDHFGTICAQRLLASMRSAASEEPSRSHVPREQRNQLRAELASDAEQDGTAADSFASPVGGGGLIGRWLGKMLKAVRQLRGGGSPGADAPTHWTRSGRRGGAHAVLSTTTTDALEESRVDKRERGTKYPEWDVHGRRYRQDWCTVQEAEPKPRKDGAPFVVPDRSGLRRSLARLGLGIDRFHRQSQGDDLDIDAVIEARVELMAGSAPDESFFVDSLRRRRDLAVLLLLDVSGSTAEPAANGKTVHEQQQAAAAALTLALHELGDRVALYAFNSQGRSAVNVMPVKRFDEGSGALVVQRLQRLVPGAYSRLGAAIRHGSATLRDHAGTPRQLLVVLSDGLAYDHGYEPVYGAADARRALSEARRQGVGCLCLSVGASTDVEALRRVFGSSAHATLPAPEQLSQVIGPLFRSAIRSADVRRRVS